MGDKGTTKFGGFACLISIAVAFDADLASLKELVMISSSPLLYWRPHLIVALLHTCPFSISSEPDLWRIVRA